MGQLKVRFTIEHQEEQSSFTSLSDLQQHSYSKLLSNRLMDFELRLKQVAADVWLRQRIGPDHTSNILITLAQEECNSELTDCMPRA